VSGLSYRAGPALRRLGSGLGGVPPV